MKELELMDYAGHKYPTRIDLDHLDNILQIEITVMTGDEIATVLYGNGTVVEFDSSCNAPRALDFFDGKYCLYLVNGINRINEFINRKNSYDMAFDVLPDIDSDEVQ